MACQWGPGDQLKSSAISVVSKVISQTERNIILLRKYVLISKKIIEVVTGKKNVNGIILA